MNNDEHSMGKWISILYRYRQSYLSKKLGDYNIGKGQYIILLTLYGKGGIRQEDLSGYLKIDKGCIAKSVKKLEDEGYIERSVDEKDKRAYRISLTQKGLDIIPVVQDAIKSFEDMIMSDLSDDEKQVVEQLLFKMAKKAYSAKII